VPPLQTLSIFTLLHLTLYLSHTRQPAKSEERRATWILISTDIYRIRKVSVIPSLLLMDLAYLGKDNILDLCGNVWTTMMVSMVSLGKTKDI
jgi:hypothetical protein